MGALILMLPHLWFARHWCTAGDTHKHTHKPQDKAEAHLTETQWHADVVRVNLHAKHRSDSYHTGLDVISIIFIQGRNIWKSHLQGNGWNNTQSIVHRQYEINYAYSKYVNVCLRKRGYNSRARSGRSIPSEHAESAPGFPAPLIAVYTFPESPTLQHCCASRCSFSDANP